MNTLKKISISVDERLWKRFRIMSLTDGMSMSAMLSELMREKLKHTRF